MMSFFVAKIIVSVLSVIGLSLIAENVSPKVAGILAGFPLGTAIVLFFVGLENGSSFAANSSVYTLSGLTASLTLVYVYYKASFLHPKAGILVSSLSAIAGFLAVAAILSELSLGLAGGLALTLTAIVFFARRLKHISNTCVANKVKPGIGVLLCRAGMAAAIVLVITGLAKVIGPQWLGVLSAFPVTLFPFLLIIHLTYGQAQVHTIIKNYPWGLGALVTYTLMVSVTYSPFGVFIGTLMSFVAAILYLLLYVLAGKVWAGRTAQGSR